MTTAKQRLGRPPATSSAETRNRILEVARLSFAESGYEATTNRALAEAAGITTGAIYHYFESKLAIYLAVSEDVEALVFQRFTDAAASATTFVAKLEAILDEAHDLNVEDPTLAQFLGTSRIDQQRLSILSEQLPPSSASGFFRAMVQVGVDNGEINQADFERVYAVVRIITAGLTDAVSHDNERHRLAVDGVKALLEGTLIRPPA